MKRIFIPISIVLLLGLQSPLYGLSEKGFETLSIFTKILHYVENDYVEEVDEEKLLRGAIRGMLNHLDPHTVYLSPQIYKLLKADTAGVFGGVGLEITVRDGWVTVVSPLEGTPAFHAGIKPGDRILTIDGESTKGMDLGTAVKEMRGRRGSRVHLRIGRRGVKNPINVILMRKVIRAPSIRAELLEEIYPYVKISSFQERTGDDLRKVIKKYKKKIYSKGLIIDLRNNPGGLLDQAVKVSDQFLDEGVIVSTKSKKGEIDRKEAREGEPGATKFPLIVLVNGGSASASEIVAGALQDHGRAVILGTQTFGKGSVQSVIEMEDGSALKMTIAKYFTPSGRSIQAKGIHPDIIVEPAPGPKQEVDTFRVREENLKGHLSSGGEPKPISKTDVERSVPFDYQKEVALNYLKSWDIFQKQKPLSKSGK